MASSPSPQRPSPLTLPVVLTGVVLVAMSISGTAVALPSMGRELDASGSALNWVVAGYNLAFAAMTLVAGSTADRVGRRKTFVASAVVLSCGFLVTAVSPSVLFTDAARIVSGAGGAGIMAAGGAVLAASYEETSRNRAFALMGTMAGVGIAVGPTLSGLLISATGWRGSFVVFTALGTLITAGATRMHESRAATARVDWAGSILFTVALCLLMFAPLEAPSLGWTDGAVVVAAISGVIALVVFGVVQRRSAHPVLEPALLTNRGFIGWSLATLTTSVGFLGLLVFLPTYLQAAAHLAPAAAGAAMLLLTVPILVTPLAAVALVNRGVPARRLVLLALVMVTLGNLSLVTLSPDNTLLGATAPLLAIGTGMGTSFGITDGQAMALVPAESVGMAVGFLNTLRGAAEAMVIAAFGAALLGFLGSRLGSDDRAAAVSAGQLSDIHRLAELAALTWSWRMTQLGIGLLCLLLTLTVMALIRHHGPSRQNA
ncbi:MFS transporter [Streptomyces sp. col6]|uniref:MFS transporter n=1 Tax=Streptomyces sp. col6 TaxID=2478958 RepID=UPI001CD0FB11|nr:MFS transporter [Streptomyces sp. col6]